MRSIVSILKIPTGMMWSAQFCEHPYHDTKESGYFRHDSPQTIFQDSIPLVSHSILRYSRKENGAWDFDVGWIYRKRVGGGAALRSGGGGVRVHGAVRGARARTGEQSSPANGRHSYPGFLGPTWRYPVQSGCYPGKMIRIKPCALHPEAADNFRTNYLSL
jgi:hypothetical protein